MTNPAVIGQTQLLTEADLAARWQVSQGHLANQRSSGRGPSYVKLGKSVRYRLADIEKFERDSQAQHAGRARTSGRRWVGGQGK